MIKSYKIMLLPNNKQKSKLFGIAGATRFAYNWAIAKEKENYNNGGKFINQFDLRKEFTKLKNQEDYKWLYNYSNDALKQSIKDACIAFDNFFKGLSDYPKFKSKHKTSPSFYCDPFKIEFTDTHIKLEKISNSTKKNRAKLNWIRLAEHGRIPVNVKYYNPRITFDGLNWWFSVGVEDEIKKDTKEYSEGIGIDFGIKNLLICSDGNKFSNINKSKKVKSLEKRKKRLQRSISRKYQQNKKGEKFLKTNNIKKLEKKTLKINRRLTNIRTNHLYLCINDIINRKPRFINIEDLNVNGMLKNHKLAKAISEVSFNKLRNILTYKCKRNDIELRIIDRWYPSSKTCSNCGSIKKDLKLKERIYVCECCGLAIDRDYNASINILKYKF